MISRTLHFRRAERSRNEEERILPLINVVFLLLIFFMLAGRLAASDPFQVAPPNSASEGLVGQRELLVLLGADGRLALNGQEIPREALQAALAGRMEGENPPKVQLKADSQTDAASVVAVMEILRAAGVARLKLLAVSEPGGGGGG